MDMVVFNKLKLFLLESSQKYLVFCRKFLLKTQGGNYLKKKSNNFFKVKGVENDLIELYDLFGRKIECKINDDIFNTENLERGVYFLIIKEKNISFKLVKS